MSATYRQDSKLTPESLEKDPSNKLYGRGARVRLSAEQVRDQLQGRINIIIDGGASPRDIASTIIDLSDENERWRIIREGAIPADEISNFFAQG